MIRLIDWILGVLGLQRKVSALSLDEVFILAIPRSSKWATVRKKHLQKQPICQVCGAEDNLQVHHIEPFHNDPDKELDDNNLITLCDKNCHLLIGHFMNFKSWNPDVVNECKIMQEKIKNRRYI